MAEVRVGLRLGESIKEMRDLKDNFGLRGIL
jgi:hypothetical protein